MKTLLCALALLVGLGAWAANPSFNDSAFVPALPFGAIGDGVNDDTAALQSAINIAAASASTNGVLQLPYGRFRITQPLIFPTMRMVTNGVVPVNAGFTLRGAGITRTIIDASNLGNNGAALTFTNDCNSGIGIEGLCLVGPQNSAIQTVGIAMGVSSSNPSNIISHSSGYAGDQNWIRNVAIWGFSSGIEATNQWGLTIFDAMISSNSNWEIKFVNCHSSEINNCQMFGGWPYCGANGIGYVGVPPAVGDDALIYNTHILLHTNAIVNNEVTLNVQSPHFENCARYYVSSNSTVGYTTLTWNGGYILEQPAMPLFDTTAFPALMEFPRRIAPRVVVMNPSFDNTYNSRAWFNIWSDGQSTIQWPVVYRGFAPLWTQTYPALTDYTNSYNVPLANAVFPLATGTLEAPNAVYNSPANNFAGFVGCAFVSTNDLWLTSMGAFSINGFTNKAHQVLLLNLDLTTNGFVTLPKTREFNTYISAPCRLHITSGVTNYLVVDTQNNGDYFGFGAPTSLDTNITSFWLVHQATIGAITAGLTNDRYGPVNFTYLLGNGSQSANVVEGSSVVKPPGLFVQGALQVTNPASATVAPTMISNAFILNHAETLTASPSKDPTLFAGIQSGRAFFAGQLNTGFKGAFMSENLNFVDGVGWRTLDTTLDGWIFNLGPSGPSSSNSASMSWAAANGQATTKLNVDTNGNLSASGNVTATTNIVALNELVSTNGIYSGATNTVLNTAVTGYTNSSVAPGVGGTNAMVVNVRSTSGTLEIYWKSGANGQTICGLPIVTNTLFTGWDTVVLPINCGFVIRSGVGIRIDAAAF